MKIIKNTLVFLFLITTLGFTGYSFYQYSLDACDRPLKYAIGRFDSQFGIPKEVFLSEIETAGSVWEKELKKDVFIYDPNAKFKINLIYDERQRDTVQKQKTEFGLSAAEDVLDKFDKELALGKASYESQVASHEQRVAAFEVAQKNYESKVNYWNAKGGAPKKDYELLQKESEALRSEADALNRETAVLNAATKELNALLDRRNQAALEYNKIAANYNQKYGTGLEFNQAEYTGKEINVYQFGNKGELESALTHEFGHALGMDHTENSQSIMYYLHDAKSEGSLKPSAEDRAELKRVCK